MATSDRPSGLTALAVINFLLAFLQGIAILQALIGRYLIEPSAVGGRNRGADQENARILLEALQQIPTPTVIFLVALMGISGALLFATAIGYLKRKRFWGRTLTTVYVVVDLGYVAGILTLTSEAFVRSLGIGLIRTAFYPIFLGVVIHTIFRRDLVR